MQYNWLMRRNKAIGEELARFANDVHGYMMSGGAVRPSIPSRPTPPAPPRPAGAGAASTGGAATSTAKS
jgi:biopolymer transport protein ExbB